MRTETRLDYATFELDEARTRCELWVTSGSETEKLASGSLKPFLAHLSEAQNQIVHGHTLIRLQVPSAAANGRAFASSWFTKGTVERFVRFVTTPDVLERVNIVEAERRQLEEAIGILSMGDHPTKQANGDAEEYIDGDPAVDGSKNQLLVAMDARRIMLQKEQESAFARAAAAGFDMNCMTDLMNFADCFGATRLRDACLQFASIYKKAHEKEIQCSKDSVTDQKSSRVRRTWGSQDKKSIDQLHQSNVEPSSQISEGVAATPQHVASCPSASSQAEATLGLQQNGSPSISHQDATPHDFRTVPDSPPNLENQSPSTEGTASQQETPSSSRRLPRRSASPRRRSCSPMRKVQIARSGTRRPGLVVVRNINYATTSFQDSTQTSQADEEGDSSDESESMVKNEDSNEERHRRLSVQDAINLFERRQREAQTVKTDKRRDSEKSVFRRWSSVGDNSTAVTSGATPPNNNETSSSINSSQEQSNKVDGVQVDTSQASIPRADPGSTSERRKSWGAATIDLERTFQQLKLQEAALPAVRSTKESIEQKATEFGFRYRGERSGRGSVSRSWSATSQQELVALGEEAEMAAQEKLGVARRGDQGRFYEQYREIRDAKFRQESGLKRAERESKLKAMQESLEKRKAELVAGGGRSSEKLNQDKSLKTPTPRKATVRTPQSRPAAASRTSPTLSSPQLISPRTSRQLPAEQKLVAAKKMSPSAPKSSTARGVSSLPKTIAKQSTPPAQRRSGPSNQDNPLTRSMPSLSELRKENTRPSAARGSPAQLSKAPPTKSPQPKPGVTASRHRSISKVMPLEPNGVVASDTQVHLAEDRSRKSWRKPMEDIQIVMPLKPVKETEVAKDLVMQQESTAFIRGTGPAAGYGVMNQKVISVSEEEPGDDDEGSSTSLAETQATKAETEPRVTKFQPEGSCSVRESQDMDIDDDDKASSNQPETPSELVQPLVRTLEEQSRKGVVEEKEEENVAAVPPQVLLGAASVDRTPSSLTLMQQLAGDDFVHSSQLMAFSHVPSSDRRASLPSLGSASSTTGGASYVRHSLSPDSEGSKVERRKWGQKPILLAHQRQQHQQQQLQQLQQQQQASKEGPKGFKRLLKFGRKSNRGSSNSAAEWVSASTTSEGEDTDESSGYASSHFHRRAAADDVSNGNGSKSSFFSLSTFRSRGSDSKSK